jgi:hypothetical protein
VRRAERASIRLDQIAEFQGGGVSVRHPVGAEAEAEAAVALLSTLWPVVQRYLGVVADGEAVGGAGGLRLELLAEPRVSGANPATGVLRHAIRGLQRPSARTAGMLSYQLGRIAWYRCTREGALPWSTPRSPDWLVEAALLPLVRAWDDRDAWTAYLAEQAGVFRWRKPLPEPLLRDLARLGPRARLVASAQCLLRAQTLARCDDAWVRRLRRVLADEVALDGERALERATGVRRGVWEERFARDLEQACATVRDLPAAPW